MAFSDDEVARLLGCVQTLQAARDERQAAPAITRCIARAIDCQLALHVTVDPRRRAATVVCWPTGAHLPQIDDWLVSAHERDHPLLRHLRVDRSIRAWRLTDVDGHAGFAQSALYRDVHAALPARRQMAMRLASPDGHLHGVVLMRSGAEFSELERRTLELLWPHLVHALRSARRARRFGVGTPAAERPREERGIVLLDSSLGVRLCSEQARLWFAEYFPHQRSRYRLVLPPLVAEWARGRIDSEAFGQRNPVPVRDPLIVQRGGRYLALDLIVDHGKGEHLLVLVEEALAAPPASLEALGLTAREAEVLSWVAQGKTNREIGMILGSSGRTVQKHLENLFRKLGVESRTAATLRAWQAGRYSAFGRI